MRRALVLPLLLLAGCNGPTQSLDEIRKESPEHQAVNFFTNTCVAGAGESDKVEKRLEKYGKNGLDNPMTSDQLRQIHLRGDEVKAGWTAINPLVGTHYFIITTTHNACIMLVEKADNEALRAQFRILTDKMAASLKSQAIKRAGPATEAKGMVIDDYYINLPTLRVGPEFSLALPEDTTKPRMLMLRKIVTQ